jgi:hypothetical protein
VKDPTVGRCRLIAGLLARRGGGGNQLDDVLRPAVIAVQPVQIRFASSDPGRWRLFLNALNFA